MNVTLSADRANVGITGQQRPDLVGAVPALNCVADPDPTKRHQLMNCFDYFQFGHKADLFPNSAFKTLFLNAIRWASER